MAIPATLATLARGSGAFMQAIAVKGTVRGSDGTPIPGVTIQVKGTTTGTVSQPDGTYSINVPDANATLQFSYIGYTQQEIPLSGRTTLDVVMSSSASELEQVVVIGYGTRRKRDVTGAVGSVRGEEIAKTASRKHRHPGRAGQTGRRADHQLRPAGLPAPGSCTRYG